MLAYFTVLVCLTRAQPGSLDITFNPGSGESPPSTFCLALQTNGQILLGGNFTSFNGANRTRIARLNADGSLDTAFDPGEGPNGGVNALAVQPDGKVLIAGSFYLLNGVPWNHVARLRADASVDVSFDVSSTNGPNGYVGAVAWQPDGKVLIGGQFSGVSGAPCGAVARLNTNGTLDATFNLGTGLGGQNAQAFALGLLSTGKILVGGVFSTINGISRNCLALLNPDGSVDTTFDAGLASPLAGVSALAILPHDKIIIVGSFSSVNGYSRNPARLNADGSVDTTFDPGLWGGKEIESIAVRGDGRVVIGGGFTQVNGISRLGVAQLNSDGTLDLTFNPGTGAVDVLCVAVQSDGKTLVGGGFAQFNGTNISGIARLSGDNSPTNLQFMAANLYFGAYLYGTVSNTYRVEWASSPNTPSLWTPLLDVTLQTDPQFIFDTNLPAGQRFYRAVQISP